MAALNCRRIRLGALAGAVVWVIWSIVISTVVLGRLYQAATEAGQFLPQPRYPYFSVQWFVVLLVLSYILAWLYASVRATHGAGPKTALRVGLRAGFAMGFPLNFALAAWLPLNRIFPLWWMLELWVGAILATLVAGWLYRDA